MLLLKKTALFTCLFLCIISGQTAKAAELPGVSAQSAIVYQADTGRVLYEKHADNPMLIASTTKIMTALVALEHCDLQDTVTITAEMANVEGSSMYLQEGEDYTVEELLYGLMLASGNDAATAIAVHTAGDEAAFAQLMNRKAAAIGMTDTHFENPHGLDSDAHYSTALDMAKLMACAMENSSFAKIAGTNNITIKGLTYVNHNKLLWQCDGVIGGKTGYTKAAGRTLVTCCERNGQRLICVTLSDPDDWTDHAALYDWAYGAYDNHVLMEKDTRYLVTVVGEQEHLLPVEPLTDVTVFAERKEAAVYIVELPRFVYGPVHVGDKLGRIVVTLDGRQVGEVPLVAMEHFELEITDSLPFPLTTILQRIRGG